MKRILILLAALGAAACAPIGDSSLPIATELLPAPQPSAACFVELPGGHDWRTWSRIGRPVFSQVRTLEPDTL